MDRSLYSRRLDRLPEFPLPPILSKNDLEKEFHEKYFLTPKLPMPSENYFSKPNPLDFVGVQRNLPALPTPLDFTGIQPWVKKEYPSSRSPSPQPTPDQELEKLVPPPVETEDLADLFGFMTEPSSPQTLSLNATDFLFSTEVILKEKQTDAKQATEEKTAEKKASGKKRRPLRKKKRVPPKPMLRKRVPPPKPVLHKQPSEQSLAPQDFLKQDSGDEEEIQVLSVHPTAAPFYYPSRSYKRSVKRKRPIPEVKIEGRKRTRAAPARPAVAMASAKPAVAMAPAKPAVAVAPARKATKTDVVPYVTPVKKRTPVKRKKRSSGRQQVQCLICGREMKDPWKLKRHFIVHTQTRTFNCKERNCDKKFGNKGALTLHMNVIHKGLKKYECTTCGAKFGYRSSYTAHLVTHSEARPFACRTCGKTFKRNNKMKWHERIHRSPAERSAPKKPRLAKRGVPQTVTQRAPQLQIHPSIAIKQELFGVIPPQHPLLCEPTLFKPWG